MMGIGSAGGIAASALSAFGVDMMVHANNIANMNTNGFRSQRLDLMTGASDQGVAVASIYHNITPGPLVPGMLSMSESGRTQMVPGYLEGSNTDVAQEFIRMTATQRAYEANAAVIRTHDDMSGTLLDLKI